MNMFWGSSLTPKKKTIYTFVVFRMFSALLPGASAAFVDPNIAETSAQVAGDAAIELDQEYTSISEKVQAPERTAGQAEGS